jgi:NhaA family Na+:H+ antiporter
VVRIGWASLPEGVGWRHIYGAAWLGGIGFTMSLFVATLAYGDGAVALDLAKVGILAASLIAGVGGFTILRGAATEAPSNHDRGDNRGSRPSPDAPDDVPPG